jgi:large subunit ribosomal protein L21
MYAIIPLLVVQEDGTAVSDRAALASASVTAKVLGESKGPKVDIFKYKNKTGYRRRMGHRQRYTLLEVTAIALGGKPAKKKVPAKAAAPVVAAAASSEEE